MELCAVSLKGEEYVTGRIGHSDAEWDLLVLHGLWKGEIADRVA